ncbi:LysR family transcriptional regulator [uncultured Roseobacter sp.]|uniref:LysR family transcriptional regulator n=1 Tax=uncultured Roseobacter sp. TaxID=114847 RepID=UPI00261F4AC0|nr:LysR family transcriptional regulator [uncultured Roseobacter sp.]
MDVRTGFRRLRYFDKVAETLNFRRAARSLGITQPALSRAIALLEAELGVRLLERTKTGTTLTPAGKVFHAECGRVFAALNHAAEEAQRVARGEIGSLAIGYTDTAIAGAIPDIIETFRQEMPNVGIRLHQVNTSAQLTMLHNGQLDIGLATGPVDQSVFSAITVQRERLVAILPNGHRLSGRNAIAVEDLTDEPFVLGDPIDWRVYNRHLHELCEKAGFSPRVIQTAPEAQAIIGLVRCGLGVTIMPACHAKMSNGHITSIPLADEIAPMVTEAVWIETRDHPALSRFCGHLEKYDLTQVPNEPIAPKAEV